MTVNADLLEAIKFLLPSFLAVWVYYGLVARRKHDQFERVIEALIFTALAQAVTTVFRWGYESAAPSGQWPQWTKEATHVVAALNAVWIGFVCAVFANRDWLHSLLRHWKVTERTSYPSEWTGAFTRMKSWVILHIRVEDRDHSFTRRLYGWVMEYPDDPKMGHFSIVEASWLKADNEQVDLKELELVLVSAEKVELVEFMKDQPPPPNTDSLPD